MSKRFSYNLNSLDFILKGDTLEQTNDPDWVYNDSGHINYLDGVSTGCVHKSEVKVYYDPSVIRMKDG